MTARAFTLGIALGTAMLAVACSRDSVPTADTSYDAPALDTVSVRVQTVDLETVLDGNGYNLTEDDVGRKPTSADGNAAPLVGFVRL